MWNSIQEEADLYKEKLQNTWDLPKRVVKDGIISPWESLNKLIVQFRFGECYVFGGSSVCSCLDNFRTYLLWYLSQKSIPIEVRGGKADDFGHMVSLENGLSEYNMAHRANEPERKQILKTVDSLRQKSIEWIPLDVPLRCDKTKIYFFSVSLNTWIDHSFTFANIAKEKKVLCFVFVYIDIGERSQYKNPYYLTLEDFCISGIRAHKDYADYMGVIYHYVPIIHDTQIDMGKMAPSMVISMTDTRRFYKTMFYLGEDSKFRLTECDVTVY